MKADSPRWKQYAASPYPWEAEALTFLREQLRDTDPNRVWSLFEFVSPDGRVSEVDALVLTQKGFFLVEIKSRPGVLTGDAGTWTWKDEQGRRRSSDNPLIAANGKAKRLKSMLDSQRALRDYELPFLQPVVFLSAEDIDVQLDATGRQHVFTRDREAKGGHAHAGIVAGLTQLTPKDEADLRRRPIHQALGSAIARALEQLGVRESRGQRAFGGYELERPLQEGPGFQDWLAHNTSLDRVQRRIRIYALAADAAPAAREMLQRAAEREFRVLQDVRHEGILQALDFQQDERGPGIVFAHDPEARRLDHFLREEGDALSLADRLPILRQIAEAVQHAHDRRLVHRALSPQSVLVRRLPKGGFATHVYNWQTAAREGSLTAGTISTTQHLDALVDPAAVLYLAPETQDDPTQRAEHLDVFGLGGIAWLLFAGEPPAKDRGGLIERLRREDGLLLAGDAATAAGSEAVDLVRGSTRPRVTDRFATVADFLRQLDEVENQLTRPADEVHQHPTAARTGQRFPGGWTIENRLGQGSTAVVYLVGRGSGGRREQRVLKLALEPAKNAVLEAERDVLARLHHQGIVQWVGELDCAGHLGLLLARAGDESVARALRRDRRFEGGTLLRFGDDLLAALLHLEEEGVFHRDVKPDNLGIRTSARGQRHLVLFDFSLASAPLPQTQVGTRSYLDPSLGRDGRRAYDPAAERFAAAVTLFEMATGRLPKWGDGSAPEATDDEVDLADETLFPADVRAPLTEFFRRALLRDSKQRFADVEAMQQAWRAAFAPPQAARVSVASPEATRAPVDPAPVAPSAAPAPPVALPSARSPRSPRPPRAPKRRAPEREVDGSVVVVGNKSAWPEYQRCHAFVCAPGKLLQPVDHLAFYAGNAVQPVVPAVLSVHDHVRFVAGNKNPKLASVIAQVLAAEPKRRGEEHKVLLLSEPQDPATLKLPQPIANDLVSKKGRRTAFTMDRRYVRAARLLRAKKTSDLV
jgi:serine/threonine protein kinase